MLRPLQMAHAFLEEVIEPQDSVVDATMGNGNDTVFLAHLAKKVYAFDVQEKALENTAKKLAESGFENVQLILDGHERVDHYIHVPIRAAIFNLGYLPSADKSVITRPSTTIEALEKLCQALVKGGRISLMIYYGHEGGEVEKNQVLDYVSQLPQQEFTATIYQTINQINQPPFLVMLEKIKEYQHG